MPQILSAILGSSADNTINTSLVNRLRKRRFQTFRRMLTRLPKPVRVLDVGGTQVFWEMMGCCDPSVVSVVLLNQRSESVRHRNFSSVVGDATDLAGVRDREFDVVFSNAVMEHLGTLSNQEQMAAEVMRTGSNYFVQTPNRYFPIDIHYQYPLLQFAPPGLQSALAPGTIGEIRLMTAAELSRLFPAATLEREKLLGLTKSFMVHYFADVSGRKRPVDGNVSI